MKELDEAVTDAIKKNLPSAVADELKQFIAHAQIDKQRIEEHIEKVNTLTKAKDNLSSEINRLSGELNKLKVREVEFNAADEKVRTASLNQAIAQAKYEGVMSVVSLVFQNTMVKRNIFEQENSQQMSAQGYVAPISKSKNVSESVEG